MIDTRLKEISKWLNKELEDVPFNIEVASSDASFRRYFRVIQNEQSWIVMDAPPEHEDIEPFIKVADFLFHAGIDAPQIFARNLEQGFLLLTDFGNQPYLSSLNTDTADQLYRLAIDEIIRMQKSNSKEITLPDYDQALLQREMDLFADWFLQHHLQLTVPNWLGDIHTLLIDSAQQQPQYFVHRDYHSRNLMIPAEGEIGIIDFQDAVIGPLTYDLVSLLKDCYISWPQDKLDEWLQYYYQQAIKNTLLDADTSFDQFVRYFDLMGLQRHLKVLGIFCRLNYRDGKENYMNDLPLTLRYVLEVTERYAELSPLHDFLTTNPKIMAIL